MTQQYFQVQCDSFLPTSQLCLNPVESSQQDLLPPSTVPSTNFASVSTLAATSEVIGAGLDSGNDKEDLGDLTFTNLDNFSQILAETRYVQFVLHLTILEFFIL